LSDFVIQPNFWHEISGGLFKIENGIVLDTGGIFNKSVFKYPIAEFKTMLRNKLDTIKSWLFIKPTSVNNLVNTSDNISISPNPATDYIEISLGANGPSPLQSDVRIYDVLGQTVSFVRAGLEPATTIRIDVSGLAPGMYFVRIGDRVGKFVKL
jgi:hypothetical protein